MQLKLSILCDVTCGLRYLHNHSPCIIHCDLLSDILMTKAMVAKIGGLPQIPSSHLKKQSQMSRTRQTATTAFMPPEALDEPPEYGKDTDIFSFACIVLHTLVNQVKLHMAYKVLIHPSSNNFCIQP